MGMRYTRLLFASISNICISSATHWLSHLACIHSLWRVSSLLEQQGIYSLHSAHMQNCRCAVCTVPCRRAKYVWWINIGPLNTKNRIFITLILPPRHVCAASSRSRLLKETFSWVLLQWSFSFSFNYFDPHTAHAPPCKPLYAKISFIFVDIFVVDNCCFWLESRIPSWFIPLSVARHCWLFTENVNFNWMEYAFDVA